MCYTRGSILVPRPDSLTLLLLTLTRRTCCGASRFFDTVKRNPPTYTPLPLTHNFPTTPRRPRAEVLALIERDHDDCCDCRNTRNPVFRIEYYVQYSISRGGKWQRTKVDRHVFPRRKNREIEEKGGASVVTQRSVDPDRVGADGGALPSAGLELRLTF